MNDRIKQILNMITANGMRELTDDRLNQFAIEICELQKKECALIWSFEHNKDRTLKVKNVAE
jgi:hypothetical protein